MHARRLASSGLHLIIPHRSGRDCTQPFWRRTMTVKFIAARVSLVSRCALVSYVQLIAACRPRHGIGHSRRTLHARNVFDSRRKCVFVAAGTNSTNGNVCCSHLTRYVSSIIHEYSFLFSSFLLPHSFQCLMSFINLCKLHHTWHISLPLTCYVLSSSSSSPPHAIKHIKRPTSLVQFSRCQRNSGEPPHICLHWRCEAWACSYHIKIPEKFQFR